VRVVRCGGLLEQVLRAGIGQAAAPASAGRAINSIIGEAERELAITRPVSERSVSVTLSLDSELDSGTQEEFLRRVLTPEADEKS
jgi:hypothetical protein